MPEEKKPSNIFYVKEGKKPAHIVVTPFNVKENKSDLSSSFSVKLDIDTLNKMTSGSCIVGETSYVGSEVPEKVAVCKEGKTIKIFKIVEEK